MLEGPVFLNAVLFVLLYSNLHFHFPCYFFSVFSPHCLSLLVLVFVSVSCDFAFGFGYWGFLLCLLLYIHICSVFLLQACTFRSPKGTFFTLWIMTKTGFSRDQLICDNQWSINWRLRPEEHPMARKAGKSSQIIVAFTKLQESSINIQRGGKIWSEDFMQPARTLWSDSCTFYEVDGVSVVSPTR